MTTPDKLSVQAWKLYDSLQLLPVGIEARAKRREALELARRLAELMGDIKREEGRLERPPANAVRNGAATAR